MAWYTIIMRSQRHLIVEEVYNRNTLSVAQNRGITNCLILKNIFPCLVESYFNNQGNKIS